MSTFRLRNISFIYTENAALSGPPQGESVRVSWFSLTLCVNITETPSL